MFNLFRECQRANRNEVWSLILLGMHLSVAAAAELTLEVPCLQVRNPTSLVNTNLHEGQQRHQVGHSIFKICTYIEETMFHRGPVAVSRSLNLTLISGSRREYRLSRVLRLDLILFRHCWRWISLGRTSVAVVTMKVTMKVSGMSNCRPLFQKSLRSVL